MPSPSSVQVLYCDNHCLAVAKPAGQLTMGDQTGDRTLLDDAKDYVKATYDKPGAVFLGVVHRLDRPVSGVVLFARTTKAASRLSAQFREHRVQKVYWALVTGEVPAAGGVLEHELVKNSETNVVRVIDRPTPQSQACRLSYTRIARQRGVTLVEIRPQTGRSHQIRVQLAHAGWSILGDRKYGSREAFASGTIALHARSLSIQHPTQKVEICLRCDPPATWTRWTSGMPDSAG